MTVALPAVTLTPGVPVTIQLANMSNIKAIKLTNGTPFDVTISGFGVQGTSIVPAGTEYRLYAEIENSGSLNMLAVNNVGATGNGVVNLVVYDQVSILPPGNWPVTVPAQTVSANVSTVQTLSNETSIVGTLVIDMGVPGNTNLIQIYNDGHATWSVLQGGVVHQVIKINTSGNTLQLGMLGDNIEILGGAFVDGGLSVGGVASVGVVNGTNFNASANISTNQYNDASGNSVIAITPGSVTRLQTNTGGTLAFQTGGVNQATMSAAAGLVVSNPASANGFSLNAGSFNYGLYAGSLSRLTTGTFVSAVGAQTISHGLGAVPSCVTMECDDSTPSTTTHTAYAYTSTQFTSFCNNSGLTMRWMAWRA